MPPRPSVCRWSGAPDGARGALCRPWPYNLRGCGARFGRGAGDQLPSSQRLGAVVGACSCRETVGSTLEWRPARAERDEARHPSPAMPCCLGRTGAEFDALLASLIGDHAPHGAAEHHLVEELAVTVWRKQRVLLAEAASHRAGLHRDLEWDRQGLVRRALPHLRVGLSQVDDPKAAVAASPRRRGRAGAAGRGRGRHQGGRPDPQGRRAGCLREGPRSLTDDIRDWWDEALLESSMVRALAEDARDGPMTSCVDPTRRACCGTWRTCPNGSKQRGRRSRGGARSAPRPWVRRSTSSGWTRSPATRPTWTESSVGRSLCCSSSRR